MTPAGCSDVGASRGACEYKAVGGDRVTGVEPSTALTASSMVLAMRRLREGGREGALGGEPSALSASMSRTFFILQRQHARCVKDTILHAIAQATVAAEVEQITDGYSILVGKGGFGEVYKGILDDGCPVAVKRFMHGTKKEEFAKEVIVHSQINHKNVVRLFGCCTEENALMIIMEFICNGNLDNILHCSNTDGHVPFPLYKRLNIAIEVAEALWCMHSMYSPVLHGDVKPANILLDENHSTKISDFGIARLLCSNGAQHTKNIIGSRGYLDPAFCENGILTPKSDVYSFGVVLLEIITRKKAVDGTFILAHSFREAIEKGKSVMDLFDEEINDTENTNFLQDIGKLAVKCLRRDVEVRPEMIEVAISLRMIRKALEGEQGSQNQQHISAPNKSIPWKNVESTAHQFGNLNVFKRKEIKHVTRNYSMIFREEFHERLFSGVLGTVHAVIVKQVTTSSKTDRDPKDVSGHLFNAKSDVYSFGIVLLELIAWKTAGFILGGRAHMLTTDFLDTYRTHGGAADLFVNKVYDEEGRCFLDEAIAIGVECLELDVQMRPEMSDVLSRLRVISAAQSIRSKLMGAQAKDFGDDGPNQHIAPSPVNNAVKTPPVAASTISLDILKKITRNFSNNVLIGEGSHDVVFLGILKDGKKSAVKKFDPNTELQISTISRILKHDNVVQILEYFIEGQNRILAYEYAPKGSLYDILHGKKGITRAQPGPPLSWMQRVKIALSAAKGLEFLHDKAVPPVIHTNIKSSNILLFDNDVAKIGDLGVSRPIDVDSDERFPRTFFSYEAPECRVTRQYSAKSDVYSFGIVLMELLTGRKVVDGYNETQ
uniref:Protein kinase domain-containing protein n=1 Tax=Leersia perrieri TaxID=77586 RepID=A0A0D9V171_9ORYZ